MALFKAHCLTSKGTRHATTCQFHGQGVHCSQIFRGQGRFPQKIEFSLVYGQGTRSLGYSQRASLDLLSAQTLITIHMKRKQVLTGTQALASYSDTQLQLKQMLEGQGTLAEAIYSTLAHWTSLKVLPSPTTVTGVQDTAELLEADITDYYIRCKGDNESIGLLFSKIAGLPIPHFIVCRILELDQLTRHKATFGLKPLKPSLSQFKAAMKGAMNARNGTGFQANNPKTRPTACPHRLHHADQISSALTFPHDVTRGTRLDGKTDNEPGTTPIHRQTPTIGNAPSPSQNTAQPPILPLGSPLRMHETKSRHYGQHTRNHLPYSQRSPRG